jgi:hypothetical protein
MVEITVQREVWEKKNRIRSKLLKTPLAVSFWSFWLQLLEMEPADSRLNTEMFWNLLEERTRSEKEDPTPPDARHAQMAYDIDISIGWRRLFRSKNGFIGIGAKALKAEDQIWILAGKSTPVILRSLANGHFKFVGEAYVHGVMHGEGLELGFEQRSITLE